MDDKYWKNELKLIKWYLCSDPWNELDKPEEAEEDEEE